MAPPVAVPTAAPFCVLFIDEQLANITVAISIIIIVKLNLNFFII
jgi:hypothetical protein